MDSLSRFLRTLPKGWSYGVDIRNREFLIPDYFAMLGGHGITHIFNSWTDMPAVGEQMAMPESLTTPECVGCRLLLKPGRKYQDAVDAFSPYATLVPWLDQGELTIINLEDDFQRFDLPLLYAESVEIIAE